jgi:hypothetical protein
MMRAWPTELIIGIWVAWFVFWRFAARGAKPVEQQESIGSRLSYLLPLLGSALASVKVSAFLGFTVAIGALGETYRAYQRASWALVPFIY